MKRMVWGLVLLAAVATATLSGCALMPKEEELPDAPVIRKGTGTEFTMTYVQRGDLIATKRYSATYRAVRQEQLSFAVSGVRYDQVYVQEGDSVRKGQLLAELEQEAIGSDVRSQQAAVDQLQLRIDQQREQRQLAQERYAIELSYMEEEELEEAATMEEVLRPYDRAIEQLEDEWTVACARLDAMDASVRERQLRAGIDGTVTYVRRMDPSELSDRTQVVMVISDSSSSMFVVDTEDAQNFPVGMQVEVTIGLENAVYPCTVVSAQEAGAEASENKVYLKTDLTTAELSDGDRGYLMLELGRKEDVLYVNQKAVKSMDGQEFVYVQDENGLRTMVEVTTGYAADGNVEIISGLSQGDAVILK